MPFIEIRVSKPVDEATKEKLQAEIVAIMETIPGKNASNTTICICDTYTIYKEHELIEAAFIDIRLYKESPEDSKKDFVGKMFSIIDNVLSIPPDRVQMNFFEQPCWAANGELF